ncbi:MAG: hypothetical protein GXO91_01235 [FCB group bacterium]|nr:hypothetical protein [FCB group bacterium]
MKKLYPIIKALFFFTVFLLPLEAEKTQPIVINLITTNDLHGVIYEQEATFMNPAYPPTILGGAALYKYVTDLRDRNRSTAEGLLLLDGGNFFQGTPMGMTDGGATIINWMNQLGYDALTPGYYDFILGAAQLNQLAQQAAFPFLTGNLDCEQCELTDEGFLPYIIKEINGVKIGIIGIVDSDLTQKTLYRNILGISTLSEARALRKLVPEVRNKGAEVIIVLTSSGVPWDREQVYQDFLDSLQTGWDAEESPLNAMEMGYYAQGVDIIVAGGNSKGYNKPWYDPRSHTFVFQNYGNGTEFGHVKLLIDRASHDFIGYETVVDGRVSQTMLSDDFTPDNQMLDWIRLKNAQALSAQYTAPNPPILEKKPTLCDVPQIPIGRDDWKIPKIDRRDQFEIVTWNCENFPKNNEETVKALSEAIHDLNADMYALQEIRYAGWFSALMAELPQYDFIISKNSSYMDLAILYKKDMFQLVRQVELFPENDYNFAGRPPLQGDFLYICNGDTTEFSVIDLHMKCCDSGLSRRQKAAVMLHDKLAEDIAGGRENFIVLGDWNDDLKDADNAHCFQPFFDDQRFFFPTMDITYDIAQASYPKEPYVSFLDHILVTRAFVSPGAKYRVQTLPMNIYFGTYEIYEEYISDHRPVMFGFSLQKH